jgi:hypothetical protein
LKLQNSHRISLGSQGLWANWSLWNNESKHGAGKFGDWVKLSCFVGDSAGFEGLLDEVASLLAPQLLLNRPPQSQQQVLHEALPSISIHVTQLQLLSVCLRIAVLFVLVDCLRPPIYSLSQLDRALTQVRHPKHRTHRVTLPQGEWLQLISDLGISMTPGLLQSTFESMDCTGTLTFLYIVLYIR